MFLIEKGLLSQGVDEKISCFLKKTTCLCFEDHKDCVLLPLEAASKKHKVHLNQTCPVMRVF